MKCESKVRLEVFIIAFSVNEFASCWDCVPGSRWKRSRFVSRCYRCRKRQLLPLLKMSFHKTLRVLLLLLWLLKEANIILCIVYYYRYFRAIIIYITEQNFKSCPITMRLKHDILLNVRPTFESWVPFLLFQRRWICYVMSTISSLSI